ISTNFAISRLPRVHVFRSSRADSLAHVDRTSAWYRARLPEPRFRHQRESAHRTSPAHLGSSGVLATCRGGDGLDSWLSPRVLWWRVLSCSLGGRQAPTS